MNVFLLPPPRFLAQHPRPGRQAMQDRFQEQVAALGAAAHASLLDSRPGVPAVGTGRPAVLRDVRWGPNLPTTFFFLPLLQHCPVNRYMFECLCIHMCSCACTCVHVHTHVYMCIHMRTYAYTCVHLHMCTCVCTCVYVHTHFRNGVRTKKVPFCLGSDTCWFFFRPQGTGPLALILICPLLHTC